MNRRRFIYSSISCAALAATPIKLTAAEKGARKPRIPIGFLGATYSHGPDKIKLAMPSPDWEFVGVCEASDVGRQACAKLGATHLRSIYLDIVSPLAEAMRFALDFSGADKLLFSSDHPWVQPREILDPLRSLKLSANHENLILRDNARQLFHL